MKHRWQTLARWFGFPMLFGGAGMVAWTTYDPGTVAWSMPALVGAAGLLTVALERWIPFEPAWNARQPLSADAVFLGLTTLVVRAAEALVWSLLAMLAVDAFPPPVPLWPTSWPVLAQLALALAVGDFLPYLYHRASHESSGFLWRVHSVHHAPEQMYAFNFARFHPLNAASTAMLTLLPLALLGTPAPILFTATVLHNLHGLLSHSNVDFRLGPLNWIFSMTELHRWHHARDPRASNGNYGATVLVWDWLFGTRRHPRRRLAASEVGLWAGSIVPTGIVAQLGYPFALDRCRRAVRRSLRFLNCCPAS